MVGARHHRRPALAMPATRSKPEPSAAADFASFVIALMMLLEPVKRLVGIHNIFQQAIGASQKVFQYLDHTEEIAEKPGARRLARFATPDRLRRRLLPLPRGSLPASRSARLELEVEGRRSGGAGGTARRRQNHAGQPGCRASTTSPAAPSRSMAAMCAISTWPALRALIGIVAQDTFLFNDTVAHNIAYGRPDIPHRSGSAAPPKPPWRTNSSSACRRATTP